MAFEGAHEAAPFAGEYPTRDEVLEALESEFPDMDVHPHARVRMPMTGVVGTLVDGLVQYRSDTLTAHWPRMFRMMVMGAEPTNKAHPAVVPLRPGRVCPPRPRSGESVVPDAQMLS